MLSIFTGLDIAFAQADAADYAVCTGLFDDTRETPENYREAAGGNACALAVHGLRQPDIVVERGDELVYCAGALADAYAAIGGEVLYCGKPHQPIYTAALDKAGVLRGGDPPIKRVLAIGDSIRTDLKGAASFGVDCLFVVSGIHAEDFGGRDAPDLSRLDAMLAGAGVSPQAVTRRLAW